MAKELRLIGEEALASVKLLRLIGEHPFVSVKQMRRIWGASRSTVYDSLRRLEEQGLVGCVNPRDPAVRARALYFLRPAGQKRLGAPRRRGRPRFLERVATVYEVRNLLISAQRAGIPIVRWQTLTAAVRGVSLHAAAETANGGRLIVEWDRGERPMRLYRHRLRLVAALAREVGAGLLLVAADTTRGAAMLSILSGKLDMAGPHLAVTSRPILSAQGLPGAVCYVPAITESLSIHGFVRTVPERVPGEELLSRGVLSFDGKWRGYARLVLELSPLQKRLLSILVGLPLVTADDLAVLAGSRGGEWVQRMLRGMRDRGLVGVYVADPARLERHYYAAEMGLGYLAACCGAPLRAYARARGWSVRQGGVSVDHLVRAFQHTEEAREVVVALARMARSGRQAITWYDEREAHVYFPMGGRRRVLAPDARVHWNGAVFFVEVDRGTSSWGRVRDKLRMYYHFRGCAEHRRFGDSFAVVVVAPTDRREEDWLGAGLRLAREYGVAPLEVVTTTRDALRKQGVGAAIWRDARDRGRRRLVEGKA
jgi:DNA-binding MarR family transcriptional regulator